MPHKSCWRKFPASHPGCELAQSRVRVEYIEHTLTLDYIHKKNMVHMQIKCVDRKQGCWVMVTAVLLSVKKLVGKAVWVNSGSSVSIS